MANKKAAVTTEVAATAEVRSTYYDVTLSGRFTYMDFHYLPSQTHHVDQSIYDAMVEAGVVADVKQLS